MSCNKSTTKFAIHKPKFYQLKFIDVYGGEVSITGTPMQVLNYILNQQL